MLIDLLTPLVHFFAHQDELRSAAQTKQKGIERSNKIPGDVGESYAWREDMDQLDAIVGIRVVAETTPGRAARADAAASRESRSTVVRFKKDFREMRLLRDGVEVTPIVPGRFCRVEGRMNRPTEPVGCFGLYQYRPEAFAPGAVLEVQIYTENAPPTKAIVWRLPPKLVSSVWADFVGYYAHERTNEPGDQEIF